MSSLKLTHLNDYNRTLREVEIIGDLISEYEKLKGPYNPLA
jgi:hypothetical protein